MKAASAVVVAARAEKSAAASAYRLLFMVRRHDARYLPGAAVFPGGMYIGIGVDVVSIPPNIVSVDFFTAGAIDAGDLRIGGNAVEGAKVAGVREILEEAGLPLYAASSWESCHKARELLLKRPDAFEEAIRDAEGLSMEGAGDVIRAGARSLLPWSRFLAPKFEVRHFDAATFMRVMEEDVEVLAREMGNSGASCAGIGADALARALDEPTRDEEEAAALGWLLPSEALKLHDSKVLGMPPPQYMLVREMNDALHTLEDIERAGKNLALVDGLPKSLQPVLVYAELDSVQAAKYHRTHVPAVVLPHDAGHPIESLRGPAGSLNRLYFFPSDPVSPHDRWLAFEQATRAHALHDVKPVAGVIPVRSHGADLGKTRKEGVPVAKTHFHPVVSLPSLWRFNQK